MSAISAALDNLNAVINRLDKTARIIEDSKKGEQRDMFSSAPSNQNNGSTIHGETFVQKLDTAIEKVEKLLKDGTSNS